MRPVPFPTHRPPSPTASEYAGPIESRSLASPHADEAVGQAAAAAGGGYSFRGISELHGQASVNYGQLFQPKAKRRRSSSGDGGGERKEEVSRDKKPSKTRKRKAAGKKRKQYAAGGANKKSKHGAAVDLNKGIAGYLVTCEQGKEQHCQREVIAWLSQYADTMYPPQQDGADADGAEAEAVKETSVSSALAAELAELKAQQRQPRSSKARFVALDTGVRGIVFVHSRDAAVDHVQLLYRMLAELTHTRRLHTRYTIRVHPLHRTCFSRPDDLYAIAGPLLASLLPALPTAPPAGGRRTFSVQLNRRGNNALFERDAVIGRLASMWERGWKVDLDAPSVVCVVEVCGRMAGLGLVERWSEFQKFNVRALGEAVYRDGQSAGEQGERGADASAKQDTQVSVEAKESDT